MKEIYKLCPINQILKILPNYMKRSLNELPEFPIARVITPNWSTLSEIPSCWFMPISRAKNPIKFLPPILSLTFQSHFPLSFEMEWKRFVFQNWSWQQKICGNLSRKIIIQLFIKIFLHNLNILASLHKWWEAVNSDEMLISGSCTA